MRPFASAKGAYEPYWFPADNNTSQRMQPHRRIAAHAATPSHCMLACNCKVWHRLLDARLRACKPERHTWVCEAIADGETSQVDALARVLLLIRAVDVRSHCRHVVTLHMQQATCVEQCIASVPPA